jgi:hypothetical protein
MIAHASTMMPAPQNGARRPGEFVRLSESLRFVAAEQVAAVFGDVSGKRIKAAGVPGATRNSISRALNGCESNPLWRLAGWFVLCRKLGVPKEKLQRLLDWAQGQLDAAYADAPAPALEDVLDRDAELDGRDDLPRQRAARGDRRALVELLEIEEMQLAHERTVVAKLRAEITLYGV